jgi:heme/copper-type cytochrome/quinol oxidase subunit 1
VQYAVIPLAVIAIDMIVATLPLAVLLVEMIVQAITPSVHVDALLAKNVLWWFGHPTRSSTCCSSPRSRSTTC